MFNVSGLNCMTEMSTSTCYKSAKGVTMALG
jgi:hypothetical protein